MMRAWLLVGLVLWAASARAEPGDYLAWKALFTRAASAEARRAEVEAAPAFGRIWLHGYVYDLATPGIPDAEKARVRAAAEDVAAVLAARGEDAPRLLLDRADAGALGPVADAVRAGADRVIAAMRGGQAPEVAVFEAGDSLVAAALVHALLERAHIARRALGGRRRLRWWRMGRGRRRWRGWGSGGRGRGSRRRRRARGCRGGSRRWRG